MLAYQIIFGGRSRTRTYDPLIKSQLLYHLSYAPVWPASLKAAASWIYQKPARPVYGRR